MPNTLVHLGVQSVSTKALFREADFKWIAVGCVIPDIPWILQRTVLAAGPDISQYSLTQYATVQASLFFCLLLSSAIALLCAAPLRIFLLLAGNALFHLLLDAIQIKWANGVHLFAPFSWRMTSFGLLWPEHGIITALTAAGLAALLYFGAKDWRKPVLLSRNPASFAGAVILLALYCALPFWLRTGPAGADNHYTETLRNVATRTGKYIELDRSRFSARNKYVNVFSRENIKVTGNLPSQDGILSVQGRFIDNHTIEVARYHLHSPVRDISSTIALAGVLLTWLAALASRNILFEKHQQEHGTCG